MGYPRRIASQALAIVAGLSQIEPRLHVLACRAGIVAGRHEVDIDRSLRTRTGPVPFSRNKSMIGVKSDCRAVICDLDSQLYRPQNERPSRALPGSCSNEAHEQNPRGADWRNAVRGRSSSLATSGEPDVSDDRRLGARVSDGLSEGNELPVRELQAPSQFRTIDRAPKDRCELRPSADRRRRRPQRLLITDHQPRVGSLGIYPWLMRRSVRIGTNLEPDPRWTQFHSLAAVKSQADAVTLSDRDGERC